MKLRERNSMDGIVVKLLFSGLIAYSASGDGSNLVVMVPNEIGAPHMPHQAFLSVRSGGVIEKKSDFRFELDPTETTAPAFRTFVGGGYQLSISGLPGGGLEYERCRELRSSSRLQSEDKVNVCLLDAADLVDQGSVASLQALAGTGFKVANEIALRLELSSGRFGPRDQCCAGMFVTAREVGWVTPAGANSTQFVPEMLEWVTPAIAGKEIVLNFRPLDGGPARVVTVEPDGAKPIEILITNEPDPREFCSESSKTERYSATHLERLSLFSTKTPENFGVPELTDIADRMRVDAFCDALDHQGGREPVICYGQGMNR